MTSSRCSGSDRKLKRLAESGGGRRSRDLEAATEAARAGAAVLLRAGLPRPGGKAILKGASDYVTATDLAREEAIVPVLRHLTREIAVLAEESGGPRADRMWAVDPLDGTTDFTRGLSMVGVSVGLLDGLEAVHARLLEFARMSWGWSPLLVRARVEEQGAHAQAHIHRTRAVAEELPVPST